MTEQIIAPKIETKQPELTDQDLNFFLASNIRSLQINLPEEIKRAQRSGKYTIKQILDMREKGIREVAILEAILTKLVTPPPKESGCQWKPDGRGGFEVHAYISARDMADLRMPADDADLFQDLMSKNQAVGILSGMAMLFGTWEKQRQAEQKQIIKAIEGSAGTA